MTNNFTASLILGMSILKCTHSKAQNSEDVRIFKDSLISDFSDTKHALERNRPVMHFESGITANNCTSYLSEAGNSRLKESTTNLIHQKEYLSCETLHLIKGMHPIEPKITQDYGQLIASNLTLNSFPSSLYRRSRKNNSTLVDLGTENLIIKPLSVTRDTNDWTYTIEIIASADMNNDKIDDLIVWIYDRAKQGNYHTYTTLVIPLYNDNPLLKATIFSNWN